MTWEICEGDCIERLQELHEASIDAVVTDPPYGIGFMGHKWDQPGDYGAMRANGRPRPFASGSDHRELQRAMERAQRRGRHHTGTGFDTRPSDNGAFEAGRYDFSPEANQRFQAWCEAWSIETLRVLKPGGHIVVFGGTRTFHRLVAGVEDAGFEIRDQLAWLFGSGFPKGTDKARIPEQWRGAWNTALKPAHEPILLARKPMIGTLAENLAAHGTGALNIAGCVVDVDDREGYERNHSGDRGHAGTRQMDRRGATDIRAGGGSAAAGRWPANVALDEEAAELLDEQSGTLVSGANPTSRGSDKFRDVYGDFAGQEACEAKRGRDAGGASRFFYCAKASRGERGEDNDHPTVKPIALMEWLVRLVTPASGIVLDPFAGSGTTGIAALRQEFSFMGLERDPGYVSIARRRIREDAPLLNGAAEAA